jgi:hypothetical protein
VSIPFIHQANLITNLLERQEVESFYAPYSCAACGARRRAAHRRQARPRRWPPSHAATAEVLELRRAMAFDELVEQYFAFLDR